MKTRLVIAILLAIVVVESTVIALPYIENLHIRGTSTLKTSPQAISFPFTTFNQPVTNNTDHDLDPTYPGSWEVNINSSLSTSSGQSLSMAEMAFAPSGASESRSIPTLIVQERADGLLRVEYFAQSWPNTYGLLLYNSSSPGWTRGEIVSIVFRSFGPPSVVDPQTAPRSNGNLDILVGGTNVLSSYPIAWAILSEVYLYGSPGSSFVDGAIGISFYQVSG